jgi:ABC-type lipoprotein release transport system permease subunit
MQRPRVMAMFVIEAFCLSLAGTALGVLLGAGLSAFLNLVHVPVPEGAQFFTMSDTLRFAFDPGKIFAASGVIVLCTTAVSLFPSLRAARMKPVTAMSHI